MNKLGPFTAQCVDAKEMLNLSQANIRAITEAPHGTFTSIGQISLDGIEVYAGLKRRSGLRGTLYRWAREAHLADKVITKYPAITDSFPLFTLPVIEVGENPRKWGKGLLTEDFTSFGTRSLAEYNNSYGTFYVQRRDITSELERTVYDALDGRVHKEAFQHMSGFAFDREVMVDFDDIGFPDESDLAPYLDVGEKLVIRLPI